jgi:hypothetical protein
MTTNNQQLMRGPMMETAKKYWWVSIPVLYITGQRIISRAKSKKKQKVHDQIFDAIVDLGYISFPVTALIAIYEFSVTRHQLTSMQQQMQRIEEGQ